MISGPAFDNPDAALAALADRLQPIRKTQRVPINDAAGRVLAAAITADRPSPAADVSAMDGYAIRLSDVATGPISVVGQAAAGRVQLTMPPRGVVQIFTGGIVPVGAEAVVKREDTIEGAGEMKFRDPSMPITAGQHIRRRGENSAAGAVVCEPGQRLHAGTIATLANFGVTVVDVIRQVSVAVLTTGDEVIAVDQTPADHQLRNSNSVAIAAALRCPWIDVLRRDHCVDRPADLTRAISASLADCDAILMSGGVSMGDHDYVPQSIYDAGGTVVFHGLPIRPGRPILGAATETGKLILGLPGNPVSTTVNTVRMGLPLLARLSGLDRWQPQAASIEITADDEQAIPLHWFRLVRMLADGRGEYVPMMGSGDLVSLGVSDGFVEIPPGHRGPYRYYSFA